MGQRERRLFQRIAVIKDLKDFHKRVVIGAEIEAYSIDMADYQIGRRLSRPRPGLSEFGERFTRDTSIGSEYNSRPFETVREAFFLLKSGLRKYIRSLYRSRDEGQDFRVPLLVGGWTNRFAGTHLHLSLAGQTLSLREATSLAYHIHDYIPFLIAIGANSPIWNKAITTRASNRLLRGSPTYFTVTKRGKLTSEDYYEMVFNPGRKTKPPTLELRILDSNIPEFVVTSLCVVKAVSLRWLQRKPACNRINHTTYVEGRQEAGLHGMRCKLPWKDDWLPAHEYLDRFLWEHREELDMMDIPEDIYEVLRLLKRRVNGARLIHDAAVQARAEHPQTWRRRFAKRYSQGLEQLLSGNSIHDFATSLNVSLPDTERVWLGRRTASIDE